MRVSFLLEKVYHCAFNTVIGIILDLQHGHANFPDFLQFPGLRKFFL